MISFSTIIKAVNNPQTRKGPCRPQQLSHCMHSFRLNHRVQLMGGLN